MQGQLRARREAERRREKAEQKQEQARRRAQSGKGRHSIQTRRLYVGVHRPYPEQEEPPFIGRTSRHGPTSGGWGFSMRKCGYRRGLGVGIVWMVLHVREA